MLERDYVYQLIRTDTDFGGHHLNVSAEEVLQYIYVTSQRLKLAQLEFKSHLNERQVFNDIMRLLENVELRLYYTDPEDNTLVHVQLRTKSAKHLTNALLNYTHD